MANQITGQELLDYLQAQPQNQDLDTTIRGAGYVQNRGGTEGVLRTKFFTAVSAAQGLHLGPSLSRNGQGKDPSFRLKVGPGGLVPVSAAYTKKMGWEPGSYVNLEIDGDALVLVSEPASESACSVNGLAA